MTQENYILKDVSLTILILQYQQILRLKIFLKLQNERSYWMPRGFARVFKNMII